MKLYEIKVRGVDTRISIKGDSITTNNPERNAGRTRVFLETECIAEFYNIDYWRLTTVQEGKMNNLAEDRAATVFYSKYDALPENIRKKVSTEMLRHIFDAMVVPVLNEVKL